MGDFEDALGISYARPLEVRPIAAMPISEVPGEPLTPLVFGSNEESPGHVERLLEEVATHIP